jgi:peptidoglycan-N-acetylglucosamine deacetylase
VGHYGVFVHPVLRALGLRLMAWSLRSYDTLGLPAATVVRRIAAKVRPGDIILLHEGRATSVDVLKGVLSHLQRARLRTVLP